MSEEPEVPEISFIDLVQEHFGYNFDIEDYFLKYHHEHCYMDDIDIDQILPNTKHFLTNEAFHSNQVVNARLNTMILYKYQKYYILYRYPAFNDITDLDIKKRFGNLEAKNDHSDMNRYGDCLVFSEVKNFYDKSVKIIPAKEFDIYRFLGDMSKLSVNQGITFFDNMFPDNDQTRLYTYIDLLCMIKKFRDAHPNTHITLTIPLYIFNVNVKLEKYLIPDISEIIINQIYY